MLLEGCVKESHTAQAHGWESAVCNSDQQGALLRRKMSNVRVSARKT